MLTLEKSNIPYAMLQSRNTTMPKLYVKHTALHGYYHCMVCSGLATLRYSPYGHPDSFIADNTKYAYIMHDDSASVVFSLPELMEFIADKQPASISFSFVNNS